MKSLSTGRGSGLGRGCPGDQELSWACSTIEAKPDAGNLTTLPQSIHMGAWNSDARAGHHRRATALLTGPLYRAGPQLWRFPDPSTAGPAGLVTP